MGAEERTPKRWTVTVDDSPVAGPVAYIDGLTVHPGGAFEVADARLIASAPDLLAALETLLDNGDDPYPLSGRDPTVRREDIGPARAAIAKARGEA